MSFSWEWGNRSKTSRKCLPRSAFCSSRTGSLLLGRGGTLPGGHALLSGVTVSPADARALARLLSGTRIKVNLIPFNPHPRENFRFPSPASVDRFRDILMGAGIQTITRERRGADIRAACGQLVADSAC